MICYKDRTFCNNPNCGCDRAITLADRLGAKTVGLPISQGNMCMVLFYGGPLSQWVHCQFEVDGIAYNCAEQYMMAEKAFLFEDEEAYARIMGTSNPSIQKAWGRKVKSFDAEQWYKVARAIVVKGNLAKFGQNLDFKKYLLSTGNKTLVEASPTDLIWGIGLAVDDPRALDKTQWRGFNWLGEALMAVRSQLNECN